MGWGQDSRKLDDVLVRNHRGEAASRTQEYGAVSPYPVRNRTPSAFMQGVVSRQICGITLNQVFIFSFGPMGYGGNLAFNPTHASIRNISRNTVDMVTSTDQCVSLCQILLPLR
ncbi:predicted protein [Histoplasma capsulatum var. duboisii H88]|uniref:Predicted protein n=1 Tax=Ajellomyces capsulatus (strain H88) TaxID=544711 RepID=F0UM73_AJEC8|nr:predicted protein [Histoplasma capsulatum var. duboisii H88]